MKQFVFVFFFLSSLFGFSQKETTVYFHVEKISIKQKIVLDSTGGERYKERALQEFQLNGYTGLFLKDSVIKHSAIHYYFSFTHRFEKIILTEKSDSINQKPKSVTSKDYIATLRSINKQIVNLENNGYPFAALKIVEQTEEKNKLYLTYKIDSGLFFILDKITIKSKDKFHETTLLNLINLNSGEIYNESKIVAVENLLLTSLLYKLTRPVEIVFRQGKADLYIYIEKEKSSDADGYIGFQQDKNTQKLVLNGYVNLSLLNSLNRGETINLNWKSNPDKTQNLRAVLEYPYILKTPFAIGSKLNLQKQDTSFVRADAIFDVSYLHSYFKFGLFYQIESSTTIAKNLPTDFRDFKKNTIGVTVVFRPKMPALLAFYHPIISLSGGFFNYRSDTIDDNKQKIANNKYAIKYEQTIDFLKFFHLNNRLQFEGLSSSINLSRNELIYFGGLRSIRGFYELELIGNNVWILNNEIEFTPVSSLSFKVLYDYAVFDYTTHQYAQSVGFGFGLIAGNTKLEIIVANGFLNNNSLDLAGTKVHIGFKSSF